MAGSRIRGITVEIGGDTTGLDKALKGVNSTIRTTQTSLKDVNCFGLWYQCPVTPTRRYQVIFFILLRKGNNFGFQIIHLCVIAIVFLRLSISCSKKAPCLGRGSSYQLCL